MTKIFTVEEFEIEFYEKRIAWLKSDRQEPDPRGEWECAPAFTDGRGTWVSDRSLGDPMFLSGNIYRWKPTMKPTVVINYIELVAAEVVAPKMSQSYFVEDWRGEVMEVIWYNQTVDFTALGNRKVFLTKEDCQAMIDVQWNQRVKETK